MRDDITSFSGWAQRELTKQIILNPATADHTMTDGRWDFLEDVDDEDQQFSTVGIVRVRWQKESDTRL